MSVMASKVFSSATLARNRRPVTFVPCRAADMPEATVGPFFTLVRDIGPTRTLTVGLAVPVLGIFWGWLLLGETITAPMLAGAALVLVALGLVMRH